MADHDSDHLPIAVMPKGDEHICPYMEGWGVAASNVVPKGVERTVDRIRLVSRLGQVTAERGVALAALAENAEIPYASLRRVVSGTLVPRLDHALRIADALEVELESLFSLAPGPRRRPAVATPSNGSTRPMASSLAPSLYRRGWSDGDLAEKIGLRRERINRIKNGRASPTILEALLIAGALGARVGEMFHLEEPRGS